MQRTINVLGNGLRTLMPNCRQVGRTQSRAFDQPLSFSQRLGVALHLIACKWCRRYGRQIGFLRHAAHSHPDAMAESVPQKLSDQARERIKRKLQERST